MKLRAGFVSNSSSSSFTLTIPRELIPEIEENIYVKFFHSFFGKEDEDENNIYYVGSIDNGAEDMFDLIEDFVKDNPELELEWDY